MKTTNYQLLDSGKGKKLEQFGPYILSRPCAQAVWDLQTNPERWSQADASFSREDDTKWSKKGDLPENWTIEVANILFKLSITDFGHLGIFPEQKKFWNWIQMAIKTQTPLRSEPIKVLNLFAYSGGSTLACAKAGAQVCHLDASKGMVAWARENALLNKLDAAPIRWIIDDVNKFLQRELKRGSRYDAIILDPPTFGRGSKGEIFKIENEIIPLLEKCKALLTEDPLFILFSCHTPGFTPIAMHHLLYQMMHDKKGKIDCGEMLLEGSERTFPIPSGTYARWSHENLSTLN